MGDVGRSAQAVASVADAGITAGATIGAATLESNAAKHAADLQSQAAQNSLSFQQQQWNTTQANQKPFLQAGQSAVNTLSKDVAPGGSLAQGYDKTFDPGPAFSFSGVNLQNDPSYQFDLQQGQQAIQRSAAAQGGLVSGGALKSLDQYSQGYASNEYGNAYNRAFQAWQQNYNNALTNYNTAYNVWSNNQNNQFNRLASVAGLGQTSAAQLGATGSAAAANYSQTAAQGAAGAGNYLTQGASAIGAGIGNLGIAAGNGISGTMNALASSSYDDPYMSSGSQLAGSPNWAGYGSSPGGYMNELDMLGYQ